MNLWIINLLNLYFLILLSIQQKSSIYESSDWGIKIIIACLQTPLQKLIMQLTTLHNISLCSSSPILNPIYPSFQAYRNKAKILEILCKFLQLKCSQKNICNLSKEKFLLLFLLCLIVCRFMVFFLQFIISTIYSSIHLQ